MVPSPDEPQLIATVPLFASVMKSGSVFTPSAGCTTKIVLSPAIIAMWVKPPIGS